MKIFDMYVKRKNILDFHERFVRGHLAINSSTTAGSFNVDISPKLLVSGSTILRKIRRIIFPLRVFGKFGAK